MTNEKSSDDLYRALTDKYAIIEPAIPPAWQKDFWDENGVVTESGANFFQIPPGKTYSSHKRYRDYVDAFHREESERLRERAAEEAQQTELDQREQDQRGWTAHQDTLRQINYRHTVEQTQRNYQIDQQLDFMSRPNPFVPRFNNGL